MRTALRAALSVLALALWQAPSAAETVQGTARVGNRTIALPPGTWTKVTENIAQTAFSSGGGVSNASSFEVGLIRVAGPRVTGLIVIRTSREPSPQFGGWGLIPACTRNDLFHTAAKAHFPTDQDCVFITHTTTLIPDSRSTFVDATTTAVRRAGTVPPTFLYILTRRSDQTHFLTVVYYLAPEAAGFPSDAADWTNNGWHKANLDPARRAYMERVKVWAELAQEQTRLSFRNRPVTPLPEP
jgi:hypothetical protein